MSHALPAELLARAAEVRLLISDIDGCWTDGSIQLSPAGELVSFHVHDGYGIKQLQRAGIEVAVISGRDVPAVAQRTRYLGLQEIHLGHPDKRALAAALVQSRGLAPEQVAAFGDDLPDLALFEVAGLKCAPANAVAGVRASADYVTERSGGQGAVRELADLLLAARDAAGGR
ncbi:MAG: phenylphosphate carboxylase subunit delta [Planctomycetes bacterium]|nr:phenylphosphate carboxylase subunit delta [Planctomycetota bacterium]